MSIIKNTIIPIMAATFWIGISEFTRNEFLLKSYWTHHYQKLGIIFPSEPFNGAVWGLWSLLLAITLFILSKKFSWVQAAWLAWFVGFVMMWVVIGNLGFLPEGLLIIAIPLSLLETFVAGFIIKKLA